MKTLREFPIGFAACMVVCVSLCLCAGNASAINVTPTLDANTLQTALFSGGGAGIDLSTVTTTVSGNSVPVYGDGVGGPSAGTFTNASGTYGILPGIVISSGAAGDYGDGLNSSSGFTTDYGTPATAAQEALLDPITGGGLDHNDVTQIDIAFDMLPGFNMVYFNVAYGSDEYDEFIGSTYIDPFGMYVNGINVAFVAGLPINVDHPNMGTVGGTELDGLLGSAVSGAGNGNPQPVIGPLVHTFSSPVNPTGNLLTFIVADSSDFVLDTTAYIAQLGGTPPPQVPEPSTFLVWSMLATCAAGAGWYRRRKAR